jgi:muramidase (phage lysozyme)
MRAAGIPHEPGPDGAMTTRDDLLHALQSNNLQAFLRVVRVGEGTADEDGYRRHFGGELFDSFADHPRRAITRTIRVHGKRMPVTSTAAGAYQCIARTWDEMAQRYGLRDFSPINQDIAAAGLVARRGALLDAMEGRLDEAIRKCAKEWASLPGSAYGQPQRTLEQARLTYLAAGGSYA